MSLPTKGQIDFTLPDSIIQYGALQDGASIAIVADPDNANKRVFKVGPVNAGSIQRLRWVGVNRAMEQVFTEIRYKFEVYLEYVDTGQGNHIWVGMLNGGTTLFGFSNRSSSTGASFIAGESPVWQLWDAGQRVPPNQWATVEAYWKASTGSNDGVVKVWVNNTLVHNINHNNTNGLDGIELRSDPDSNVSSASTYFRRFAWNAVDPHSGDPDPDIWDFKVYGVQVGGQGPFGSSKIKTTFWARFDRYFWGWNGTDIIQAIFEVSTDPNFGSVDAFIQPSAGGDLIYTISGNLDPLTTYYIRVNWFSTETSTILGTSSVTSFTTLSNTQPGILKFAHGSCHSVSASRTPWNSYYYLALEGAHIYTHMGDTEYIDNTALGLAEVDSLPSDEQLDGARQRYRLSLLSWPLWEAAFTMACTFMWDDHEVKNDWYGIGTGAVDATLLANMQQAFNEYCSSRINGLFKGDIDPLFTLNDTHYYAFDTAKVRAVVIDNRRFRDKENSKFLGDTQKTWLLNQINNSSKPILLFYTGGAFVDLGNAPLANDRWIGFPTDRNDVIDAINNNPQIKKCIICSGDRHYPYVVEINNKIIEVCSSGMRQSVSSLPDNIQGTILYDGVSDLGLVDGDIIQNFAIITVNEITLETTIQQFNGEDGSELFSQSFNLDFSPPPPPSSSNNPSKRYWNYHLTGH